jgi:membrane associated rhomboid family serine protease
MVAASVGFQCPDCVREGSKGVREARTTFGGRVAADTSRVTLVLVVVNVAVFVLGLAGGERELQLRYADNPLLVADGDYKRLLTSAFLHGGLIHVVANMLALLQVGPYLEAALGRVRFLALYLLSALGGSAMSMLLSDPQGLSVGASGAIFGLFGALFVVVRRLGGDTGSITTIIVINTVIGFLVPIIDWRAHLGGLVTGAVVAAAYAYVRPGPRRTPLHVAACLAVLAVIVVTVLVRAAVLQSQFGL